MTLPRDSISQAEWHAARDRVAKGEARAALIERCARAMYTAEVDQVIKHAPSALADVLTVARELMTPPDDDLAYYSGMAEAALVEAGVIDSQEAP